ncbi:MAG TPA: cobyrinic acid a,c-diamide synthase [Actinomycetota bacterium]|nr:cobyrinic acid a,c-diamide synthase [Actinomycetota bacterium]
MPRRASLPGADLLFGEPRAARTEEPAKPAAVKSAVEAQVAAESVEPSVQPPAQAPKASPAKVSAPRPRHEEKVTFYCTDSDLTRLEAARLDLRANHRLASDRGRIVRAAIAEILDDFDARGANSLLVKRLSSE